MPTKRDIANLSSAGVNFGNAVTGVVTENKRRKEYAETIDKFLENDRLQGERDLARSIWLKDPANKGKTEYDFRQAHPHLFPEGTYSGSSKTPTSSPTTSPATSPASPKIEVVAQPDNKPPRLRLSQAVKAQEAMKLDNPLEKIQALGKAANEEELEIPNFMTWGPNI